MIRVRKDGGERQLTYEEFVREVRAGEITGSMMVLSEVLTSGVWKPAIELQFFRSWAPAGSIPSPGEPPPAEEAIGPAAPPPETPDRPWEVERMPPEGPSPISQVPRGGETEPAEGDRIPWEQQDRIGFTRGLYGTIRLAFDDGVEFARRIGSGEAAIPSVVFGIVVTAVAAIFDTVYNVGLLRFTTGLSETGGAGPFGQTTPLTPREIVFLEGIRILLFPLGMLLWSGVIHLLLRLLHRPARPFTMTFRVANYAMAPMILSVLPMCGALIGIVWAIVLTVRGLAVVQRTGLPAAALATFLPVLGYLFWLIWEMRLLPHLGGSG